MPRYALSLVLVPVLLSSAACRQESTGKLDSPRVGELSHPHAPRASADAELIGACGAPSHTALVMRQPYLQQMTPTSTKVLFTSTAVRAPIVEVTTPEGELVTEAEARRGGAVADMFTHPWSAKIDGLEPDSIYCYAIIDDSGVPISENVGFRTAPDPSARDGRDEARFIVLGDSGENSDDQWALLKQMPTVPLDFMLHVGDMAYELGTFAEFDQNFFKVYEGLLQHFPVFPVAGNHEYDTNDAFPYRVVFDLPNNERWYSFDWGPVHFLALDTEQVGPEQVRFIDRDLRANAGKKAWTVVLMHKPPYSSGSHGSELSVRKAFEPLFAKHGVDLVLTGHDHHYERTKPQRGVHYIVTGGGGAGTYAVKETEISGFAEEVIHFLYVRADSERLEVHAIDAGGREFDQLVLEK